MSLQLINHSPDLKKLRDEGYNIEIQAGHLVVSDVPYVNSKKEVKSGILVSVLSTAGDIATVPNNHVVMFAGEYPCDKDGRELDKIRHGSGQRIAENLETNHSFSSKPPGGSYKDYYEKMTAYIAIVLSHAQAIDKSVTAQTYPVIIADDCETVFNYSDTASSRAGITIPTKKLELTRIAIVGVGGTGSYVLDLVAKTPVKEIHLFDGDWFLSHNAFRSPGAASLDELMAKPKKVTYLKDLYSKMHRGIITHEYGITSSNAIELKDMGFAFLCIDSGEAKKVIVENLEAFGIPFIDVGMGVDLVTNSLCGILRVTTSTPECRDHFRSRVSLENVGENNLYNTNIQVADLNALNASLAVIKWKKLCGFYHDSEKEYHSTYSIDCNMIISDEKQETS